MPALLSSWVLGSGSSAGTNQTCNFQSGSKLPVRLPAEHELSHPVSLYRVKRSLNGAVAAAGCTTASTLARRSLDAPPAASAQQLAGISRKRLEAELLSPPLPRKSSRTLLDGEHAADMLARLHLAGPASGAPDGAH